jgi:TonB-linked SusC/RagA family outer membrane protein
VNVRVTGSNVGTTTGGNGTYALEVPENAQSLTFSFVGMEPKIVIIGTLTQIDVTMEEAAIGLEEVVVTAYSTTKRSAITGSIGVVNMAALEKHRSTDIAATLQGLVPGVQVVLTSGQPGANQDILIRGLGSMTASSAPLYVVDGVPYDLSLNSISNADIQSISILKDASASSLYGARAANGVVLITTKRGTSDKPKIDFFTTFGTSELAVPYPEKFSPARQWETVWQGLYNDGTDFMGLNDAEARQFASDKVSGAFYSPMPFTLPNGTTRQYHSGWDTDYPIGLDGKVKPDAKRLWNFDQYDYMFKHRLKQEYGLSASGAMNEKNKYFVSLGYLNDNGTYIGDNYSRYNGRLVLDSKLAKWLDMSNSVMFSSSDNKNANMDVRPTRAFSSENTYFIYDYMTGEYKQRPMIPGQLAIDNGNETGRLQYTPNMMELYYDRSNVEQNLNLSSSLTANLMPGLTFKTVYSYQMYNNARRLNIPPDNGSLLDQPENGYIERSNMVAGTNYFNNVLSYDKQFSKDHHMNVFAGQEAYMYKNSSTYAGRGGLALPFFEELDQAITYPGVSSNSDTYNLLSYFVKGQYDYKDKLFVNASYRTDGSSRFAREGRWGSFFSGGVAWMLSREKFLASTSGWLNTLKLKASYGELGNDNIGSYYGYQSFYGVGGNYYGNLGMVPVQLANPDLKWETNINMNAGFEFAMFDRLRGSFEVFQRKSKDLLLDTPLPTSSGRETILRNIGDLQNTGFEVELGLDLIRKNNILWSINGNASHYINKITSLPFGSKMSQTDLDGQGGVAYYKWEVGTSRYDMYCSDWAGINPDNGRNQWWKYSFDEEGNVIDKVKTEKFSEVNNAEQRVNVGSSLPKLYGSFGSDLKVGNFDLSMMFFYRIGGVAYDYLFAESSVLRQSWAVYEMADQAWKKPGDIADYPKIYENYSNAAYSRQNVGSSQFVFTNNFIRLKNLIVGYTLPTDLIEKFKIARLRVYLRGENLFTTGKLAAQGSDPEAVGTWGQNKSGLTYFATRNFSFGINLTF